MSRQLEAWFQDGRIVEALLGRDEYFVTDPTWRGRHNDLLVLDELIEWCAQADKRELGAASVEQAIREASDSRDVAAAFGLLLSYDLIRKDDASSTLPLDWDAISALAKDALSDNGAKIARDTQLIDLVCDVAQRLPELGIRFTKAP